MTRDRLFIPEGGAVLESTDRTAQGRCRLHPHQGVAWGGAATSRGGEFLDELRGARGPYPSRSLERAAGGVTGTSAAAAAFSHLVQAVCAGSSAAVVWVDE